MHPRCYSASPHRLCGIAFGLPRLSVLAYRVDRRDATIEPWRCQDTQCDLGALQPTAVLRCVVEIQASCASAGLFGCKGLLERGELRRVELSAHHGPLVGIRITVLKEVLALVRPVDRSAGCGEVDRRPPRQGRGAQQDVSRPDAFVCVIRPRRGVPGGAGQGMRVACLSCPGFASLLSGGCRGS